MKKVRFSILHKALIAVLMMMLPVLIAFLFTHQRSSLHLREDIVADLTMLAEAYEGQVYQFLEMNKRRAVDFSSDGFIRDELHDILEGHSPSAKRLSDHLTKNKKPLDKSIQDIHVISLDGRIISSTDKEQIGRDVSNEEFFLVGRSSVSVFESDTIHYTQDETSGHKPGEEPHVDDVELAIAAPLTDRRSTKPIGVIVNTVSLGELNKLLSGDLTKELGAVSWRRGRRATMEVYLVNRDKLMITDSIFVQDAVLRQVVSTSPVVACMDANRELSGFYKDYRGVEVGGASMCLPSIGWTLLVEVDSDELLASITRIRKNAIIAAVIVAGFIIIFFIFFYRTAVKRLINISKRSIEIGQGDFSVTLPVKGSDEITLLSESINLMASQIGKQTRELEQSEARHVKAQQIAQLGHWNLDHKKNELAWSDEVYRIFEITIPDFKESLDGFFELVHPEDRSFVEDAFNTSIEEKRPYDIIHRILLRGGKVKYVHEKGEIFFDSDGAVDVSVGTVQDVTDIKSAEEELTKLKMAIEQSVNIIMITDYSGHIEYVNPMFEQVTGFSKEEVLGEDPGILSSHETSPEIFKDMWTTITSGEIWRGTIKNRKKDGEPYWCSNVITPIRSNRGEITNFLSVQEDITAKKYAEERIERLVTYDELTGLVNRTRFTELLNEWLAFDLSAGHDTSVLLIDIDQFRSINDSFGHGAGDMILRSVAVRLEKAVNDIDARFTGKRSRESIVGRMGSDEFVIFLPDRSGASAMEAAEEIRSALMGVYAENVPVRVTVSIGLTVCPIDGTTSKSLFTKADAALIRAKGLGGNRCHQYRAEDMDLEHMHSRLKDKELIQRALDLDQFEPWFQPILSMDDKEVHHYEALARMRDEKGKIFLPGSFIPTAEAFGLIGLIDRAIMEKTMRFQAKMMKEGRSLTFAMNLSGKDMGDESPIDFIKDTIKETGADPDRLLFEITETEAIHELGRATNFIKALKEVGCKFALDDFGVGFTSFVYLKDMPVDFIKIDGYFIEHLDKNSDDQLFVKAIVDVADGLGIRTVAEFVQNDETIELLDELGVDFAQGFHIGIPSANLLL
ncbi:MAG: EAL domain-containing protein [Proteobacteria bacterium]|nr:EAL domain-containing protein [Pseudomonadota bacterium]